jgi:hypothetical protein
MIDMACAMLARSLATYCLLTAGLLAGASDPIEPNLAVYLKTAPNQPNFPLQWMQGELSQIMSQAGYAIEWRDARATAQTYPDISNLAVVELRGICGLPAGPVQPVEPIEEHEALASTPVAEGRVLPFSTVNCAAVTHLLVPALAEEAAARRDFVYGRALARIMAHELYHVLTGRGDHDREGIAKAGFTVRDLVGERFDFEQTTLSKLRPLPGTNGASITESPSVRQ